MRLKTILKIFTIWRAYLLIVGLIAAFFIPLLPQFHIQTQNFTPYNLLSMWANFDGIHYLSLVRFGYHDPSTLYHEAFFPFYPLLISLVSKLHITPLVSATLISNITFVFALYYLGKLLLLDYKKPLVNRVFLFLLIFPTSFFFTSVYTESLFLLLIILSFYAARKKSWLYASIFAGLASATRVTGIFLLPALIIEYTKVEKVNLTNALKKPTFYLLSLSSLGLVLYMHFLNEVASDPLYFLHVQPYFGAARVADHFILIYQVIYRYIKMVIFIDHTSTLFFSVLLEFLSGILGLILLLLSFKYTRSSYALFAILTYFAASLTGTFVSLPRYLLVLFPIFITLSKIYPKFPKPIKILLISSLIIFQFISISLFTRAYFIA